ncbi:MarR family transcriptional regulator [Mycobacterium saskatchewanense]|uniref:MarR family transcriptional regulator n=2 Tax=Mycobacterium saskatchewanense TaxID=220927 RepID=A0AAJ3NLS7_9MYCO|nr:MarR family transcriptional regulator [Mycobacterium saskatchewanense]BBX64028.1 MarR family transcriptional regulator [Mycobacterium saskatchewanense]
MQGMVSCMSAAENFTDNLVQTSFAVTAILNRVASEHDLSLTQLRVLGILRDREPTMAELASYLGLERSTVSGLIDRAVGRGLVRKTTDAADGRSVRVSLTAEARRLAPAIIAEIGELLSPMTSRLNPGEQQRLTALLGKVLTV